jgi:hypothetical protein
LPSPDVRPRDSFSRHRVLRAMINGAGATRMRIDPATMK